MNKLFIMALLIATTAIFCKKDDNIPEEREKKVLLARNSTAYTYDGSTMITDYVLQCQHSSYRKSCYGRLRGSCKPH